MSARAPSRSVLLALAFLAPWISGSCVFRVRDAQVTTETWTDYEQREEAYEHAHRSSTHPGAAAKPAQIDATEAEEKAHALEVARLELQIAQAKAASSLEGARAARIDALVKLEVARAEHARFEQLERPLAIARAELSLDQHADAVEVARAELAQMEHDFAEAA